MPFYIRKAFSINKFFKINLSKSGLGWSFGRTGIRLGQKPDGQTYVHGGRYGLYFRENIGKIAVGGMVIAFVMLFVLSGALSHTGIGNDRVGFNSRGEEVYVGPRGGKYVVRYGKKVYGSAAIVVSQTRENESQSSVDDKLERQRIESEKIMRDSVVKYAESLKRAEENRLEEKRFEEWQKAARKQREDEEKYWEKKYDEMREERQQKREKEEADISTPIEVGE